MFENILGNEEIKKRLELSIKSSKILHSYLFTGIDGIGKFLLAKEFAQNILCLNKEENVDCTSCIKFKTDNHPDYILIEPDGNAIKIEQIRNLQKRIYEKPIISDKKICIINDAESMTKEAQNCLLKTLEEPPEYIVIILISKNESNLLTTIKSRCIITRFAKISSEEIKKYIEKNYNDLNITEQLLESLQGSIGKIETISEEQEKYSNIQKIINELGKNDIIEILKTEASCPENAVDMLMVAKYLERIADHAVNVSEWVIFSITGLHKGEKCEN